MTWAPISHLRPELGKFRTTAEAVVWACTDPAGLKAIRYLREAIEMASRLQAADPRVTFLSADDKHVLSAFIAENPDELYRARTTVNRQIAAFGLDDWMSAADASPGSDDQVEWSLIENCRDTLIASSSSAQFINMAADGTSRSYLLNCREVLEAAISIKCADPRMGFLSLSDRKVLVPFTNESAHQLAGSLRRMNLLISKLHLDPRTDVTEIVGLLLDPPRSPS